MDAHYDAVVVGGRCAGAATAMLLARGGLRVLALDAARPGTDTPSTHALMRGGVLQLHRWGLLDAVVAAGTPAVTSTEFHYGDDAERVAIRPGGGVDALRAPRRTVLDALLVDAARAAGAEVRHGTRVTRVLRDTAGAVTGVEHASRTGGTARALAPLTIGADGRRSTIAEAVAAPFVRCGTAAPAMLYTYWSGPDLDRYRWFYRPGATAGVIPTNDGRVCVWAGTPAQRFGAELRADLGAGYRQLLAEAAPELTGELAQARPAGPVRAFPGAPGFLRRAAGPGWALVGDAGYYKDPLTAHGITDALRDAELLARAVLAAPRAGRARTDALRGYERTRDELAVPLLTIGDRLASYAWDISEVRDLLPAMSRAMRPGVALLGGLDPIRPLSPAA